jgi:hypothetical protein
MSDPSAEGALSGAVDTALDENAAASSTAETEGVKTIQDAVNDALSETEKSPASVELGKDTSAKKPEEGADADKPADEPTEDELKQYPQKTQTRIRELVSRSKTAEALVAERTQEVEKLRPQAEQMDQLVGYMRQNQIKPEDLNSSMQITALINTGKYEEALASLSPIINQLFSLTGRTLPPELQQEVETGYITPERAKELHRAKIAATQASEREKAAAERQAAASQKAEADQTIAMYGTAATAWENSKKTSDPDWSMKQPLVQDMVEAEMLRIYQSDPSKLPRDAKGVNAMLDGILAKVEKTIAPFRPAVKAITPVNGRPVSAGTTSKPGNLMEAVDQALGATG